MPARHLETDSRTDTEHEHRKTPGNHKHLKSVVLTLVPDAEKFALKSPDRFKEKLAKMMEIEPDRSPSELSTAIHDGIRYTFISDSDHYSVSADIARRELSGRGYELVNFKPSWTGKEYKGINSQWRDRINGQSFEVSIHPGERSVMVARI